MKKKVLPGINIQWPWSELILSGEKSIETRKYRIPEKYIQVPMALIETPGPKGKKEAGIKKARIIGIVTFGDSFKYNSKSQWKSDYRLHRVPTNDPQYKFSNSTAKWGWPILKVTKLRKPKSAPKKRGIIFASRCILD